MPQLTIASWNINSVRLRIDSLLAALAKYNLDVICLQETKTLDEFFPEDAIKQTGYPHIAYVGQKSYNGVAIISKLPIKKITNYQMVGRDDKRHISVELSNNLTIHNFYIPAGGDIPDRDLNDKFGHKLDFLDEIKTIFSNEQKQTIILGDFNIAPLEHDVWSHKQLAKVVSHTEIEIEKLNAIKSSAHWIDSHRKFVPINEKLYSWWSYRAKDWEKSNRGRRLDHIWLSPDLEESLLSANIHKETRGITSPSDHAIITTILNL